MSSRIAITLEDTTRSALVRWAKKEHVSIAKIVRDFVQSGLERREDKWLSELADKRDEDQRPTIGHKDAWK